MGRVTFGAVGDISLSGATERAMREDGPDWPFARMRREFSRADLLFGNLECVLVPADIPTEVRARPGLVCGSPSDEVAAALGDAGFGFLNLAQNHILDAGTTGLLHTREVLEATGIATGGVGATQEEARALRTVERDGLTFGFLCYAEDNNYTLGTRGPCHAYYERDAILDDIRRHRDHVDVLVVSAHADLEFLPTPSEPRQRLFRELARAGADLVLGHHPHVSQGCESVDGALIAYSLGHGVFASHSSPYLRQRLPETARSFLLLVEFGADGIESWERVPFTIGTPPEERPAPDEGGERARALARLAELDALAADADFVRRTWQTAAERQFSNYVRHAVTPESFRHSKWRLAAARLLGIPYPRDPVEMDRLIGELVPRLLFTAENREWLEEIGRMARAEWEAWNTEPADPHARPHDRIRNRRRSPDAPRPDRPTGTP